MFRTRDFVLIFTTIVFLISGIGVTIFSQFQSAFNNPVISEAEFQNQLLTTKDTVTGAQVAPGAELSRADRVEQMRAKIAVETIISVPEESEDLVVDDQLATSTDEIVSTGAQLCTQNSPYVGFWDARNVSVVADTSTIKVTQISLLPSGSSTERIVLELPARTLPSPATTCISLDVIGVANDGSLIRNDELALYSVFGTETLIGYALDGFPIYGNGTASVDQCGGRVVAGQYRYELQSEQTTILNCFAAAPMNLP